MVHWNKRFLAGAIVLLTACPLYAEDAPAAAPASVDLMAPAVTPSPAAESTAAPDEDSKPPTLEELLAAAKPKEEPVPAALLKGREVLESGNWREARRIAVHYLKKEDKRSAAAWTLAGDAFEARGWHKWAIRRYRKALKYEPHYAQAFLAAGKAFEAMGRKDEASNEYQAAFHADKGMTAARDAWKRLKAGGEETADN